MIVVLLIKGGKVGSRWDLLWDLNAFSQFFIFKWDQTIIGFLDCDWDIGLDGEEVYKLGLPPLDIFIIWDWDTTDGCGLVDLDWEFIGLSGLEVVVGELE